MTSVDGSESRGYSAIFTKTASPTSLVRLAKGKFGSDRSRTPVVKFAPREPQETLNRSQFG